MNNDVNGQNNLGNNIPNDQRVMDNNVNQAGTQNTINNSVNQMENQNIANNNIPQPNMMNNGIAQPNMGNNNINSQPQSFAQPVYNNAQFNPNQVQPQNNMTMSSGNKEKNNKLIIIIVIAIIGVVGLVAVIGMLSKSSKLKAKKVLTCTAHYAIEGVYGDDTYVFYINDGNMRAKETKKFDLKKLDEAGSIEGGTADEWAEQQKSEVKSECEFTTGCKVDSIKHSKGESFEYTLSYDSDFLNENSSVENYNAEEIYDQLKAGLEAQLYTCN